MKTGDEINADAMAWAKKILERDGAPHPEEMVVVIISQMALGGMAVSAGIYPNHVTKADVGVVLHGIADRNFCEEEKPPLQ